jgi:hypothetical protein|tara:strand:- start:169 stop:336 length:168 start_codon:yes stop_codon:yes gene_type:complete
MFSASDRKPFAQKKKYPIQSKKKGLVDKRLPIIENDGWGKAKHLRVLTPRPIRRH